MHNKKSSFSRKIKHLTKIFKSGDKHNQPDWVFAGLAGLLLIIGLIILTSASSVVGLKNYDDTYFFLKKQIIQGIFFGIILSLITFNISLTWLRRYSFKLFLISLLLLILVLIPQFGDSRLGASRWLNFGFISFQPSEIVKFTFVLYLAAWFDKNLNNIKSFKQTFLPFVIVLLVIGLLLLLQPDMGTMGIFVLIAVTMYFITGGNLAHISLLGVFGIGAVWLLIKAAPYRAARLTTFLNPELDPQGLGYHINQALLAIGSGGILGRGLGHSRQKFQYLPEVYGDSIFAVMAEELGFIITVLVIFIFIYFFLRGFDIARRVPESNKYASLVAVGLIAWWGWQTIVNIGAMIGLLPLTGVPWPFVSYGSTSLAINLAGLGLILNISRFSKK